MLLPTEFNHYEGALARTLRLPTLVLVQQDVLRRVVFDSSFGGYIGDFPPTAAPAWLRSKDFRVPFGYWRTALNERRDVFFGYSSGSTGAAKAIKRFLTRRGVRVLDWQTDFIPGRTILDQIQQAAALSVGGIFLFTKDDELAGRRMSVPRDNVVFEAGYFIGLKGKQNVLIVRETGSKLPADSRRRHLRGARPPTRYRANQEDARGVHRRVLMRDRRSRPSSTTWLVRFSRPWKQEQGRKGVTGPSRATSRERSRVGMAARGFQRARDYSALPREC